MLDERIRGQRILVPILAALVWLLPGGANAITIAGVEFTSWTTIDAPAGSDLSLDTPGDLYVFIPNGLFTDQVAIVAEDMIVFESGGVLDQNEPLLCVTSCDLVDFVKDQCPRNSVEKNA
jgi:hypothetical protein